MRYQPANLLGGFYKDSSKPWSAQDTLNWIPEVAQAPGTRTEAKLRTAPGLKPFVEIGQNPVRGSHNCEGKLFVVSGNLLYQISNAGIAIPIGTVPGTGLVSMSHNQRSGGNELTVVNGSAGYVYNTRTQLFTRISDPAFPGSIAVDYLDQYMLHVEPFGRYWFHSELADATQFNSLDRYESEASPDKIVTLKTNNLEVVVFNETTTEFFDNTGAANNTFQNKRAVIDVGAAGRFAVAKIDRSLIWLANDGVFYYLEGYNGRPISTPPIEQAISGFDWSRCIAKVYESEGHKIAYFTFPGGLTFGYDVVTQLWHRRGSFGMDRWRINSLTNWNRKYIAGDFQNGRLYELDWKYPLEGNQPLVRERTSGVTSDNQNRILVPYVEAIVGVGQAPVVPVGFPTQPAGPTISGNAPAGVIDEVYPQYDYTITAGDAPISSITVVSGSLPAGLTLTNGSITGTPTTTGSFKFKVRVRDTNGLFADLDDTIPVTEMPLLALAVVSKAPLTGERIVMASPDGTTWDEPFRYTAMIGEPLYNSGGVVIAVDDTVIAWGPASSGNIPARSSDGGYTWLSADGPYVMGYTGCSIGEVAFISAHVGNMKKTANKGATFTDVTNVGGYRIIASIRGNDQFLVALGGGGPCMYSTDAGALWMEGVNPGISEDYGFCTGNDENRAYIGASISGAPKLVSTQNGMSFQNHALPPLTGSLAISCVTGGNGIVVAATTEGYIVADTGSGFVIADYAVGDQYNSITFTGLVFVISGNRGTGLGGFIKTSEDGMEWTERELTEPVGILGVTAVRAP